MNRIIHGDCLEELRKLPAGFADAIVTDPPYGIDYRWSGTQNRNRWSPKIVNDHAPYIWFLPEAFRILKDRGALLCFVRYDVEDVFRRAMTLAGFRARAQVIWDKLAHGSGDVSGDFAPQHENIIFATKGRFTFPNGRPKTVLRHARMPAGHRCHPTEKPLAVMAELIQSVTRPGDVVVDPFLGSGVTAEAARSLGRQYLGIEIDRRYVEVARKRLVEAV